MKKKKKLLFPLLGILLLGVISIKCSGGDDQRDSDGYTSPTPTTVTASDLTLTVDENPINGDLLGTINGSTNNGTVQYAIVSQSSSGALDVNSSSGAVTVADATAFDFETQTTLSAVVRVSSGNVSENITITVNITDVAEVSLTLWEGPVMTFSKPNGGDPNLEVNQDRITNNVWITRGSNTSNGQGQIYNIVSETFATSSSSPAGTEWAQGTFESINNVTFTSFRAACPNQKPKNVVGQPMLLHLIEDDVYLEVRFTFWAPGKEGGFAYERTTEQ